MGLVAWIAWYVRGIEDAYAYVDDNFGPEKVENMVWYAGYGKMTLRNQVAMLELWDELGIMHKEPKQVFKFEVDTNRMTEKNQKPSFSKQFVHRSASRSRRFPEVGWLV